jgi:hypothetical protein
MKTAETVFVVPTYRLRDVAEKIEAYDEHFWSNGHSVKMMVFDDSSLANIYRLWIHQDGIVSAHTDAVQTHIKSNYMRNPLATGRFSFRKPSQA